MILKKLYLSDLEYSELMQLLSREVIKYSNCKNTPYQAIFHTLYLKFGIAGKRAIT